MHTVEEDKKIAEMTVRELKAIIRETINELLDPDYGLEIRPEIDELLRKSIESKEKIPVEKVAGELGLKW